MKRAILVLIVIMAFCLSFENRSEAARPPGDAPATTTIANSDPVSGTVFRVGSDSLGSYTNGANSVSSIVQGIGNWVLDTKPSPLRKVRIDLGDPVFGSGANPPFQAATVPVRFISKCTTNITTMLMDQTIPCPLALSIDYNGVTYALRTNENYAGTEPVTWTCLARPATKCTSWEMIPSAIKGDGQRKNVMQLVKPAVKRVPEQNLGQFYMSFKINVTTP